MTTLNTLVTIVATNTTATLLEVKKGGWSSVQLEDGSIKNVRTNSYTTNVVVNTEEVTPMNTINNIQDELDMYTEERIEMLNLAEDFNFTPEQEGMFDNSVELEALENEYLAEKEDKLSKEVSRVIRHALGYVNAVQLYKEVQGNDVMGTQVLRAILEYSRFYKKQQKTVLPVTPTLESNATLTVEQYMTNILSFYCNTHGLGSKLVEDFSQGIQEINNVYRCLTDEEVTKVGSGYSKRNLSLTYVPMLDQPISVVVRPGAVVLQAVAGSTLTLSNNRTITLSTGSVGLTTKDLQGDGVLGTIHSVVMHEEIVVDIDGKEVVSYNNTPVEFQGSLFNKIYMIKANKIDTSKLSRTGYKKVISISKTNKLKEVAYPARSNTLSVYTNISGMVSPQDAKSGYISDITNVQALASFNNNIVYSFEKVNKAVARNDKQEKITGWDAGTYKMFVAYDLTGKDTPVSNKLLSTGCAYFDEDFFGKFGLGRVTSPMFKGGVKAATNYEASWSEMYPNCGLIGPAAFKGGIYGLFGLLGMESVLPTAFYQNTRGAALKARIEAKLQEAEFLGEILKGFWVSIPLRLTNAIMVEGYKWVDTDDSEEEDTLLSRAKVLSTIDTSPNGLRDYIMDRVENNGEWASTLLMEGLEDGSIEAKPMVTRHTPGLFQSAAAWYGNSVVKGLISSLINDQEGKYSKRLGVSYLLGSQNVANKIDASEIAEILIKGSLDNKYPLSETINTYPTSTIEALLDMFYHQSEFNEENWEDLYQQVEINFNGSSVIIPNHHFLFNKAEMDSTSYTTLANNFLKEILASVKQAISVGTKDGKDTYTLQTHSLPMQGKLLKARLQQKLLGKSFGSLETFGGYQLMLPSANTNQADHRVLVTDVSLFGGKAGEETRVNGVKHPAYFEQALAGYIMEEKSTGSLVVDFAMKRAVSMSFEAIMMMLNDCDGDTHQFTNDGYNLPFFMGPKGKFNQNSFIKAVQEELDGNTLSKVKEVSTSNMEDFQEAIFEAGTAKDNIGLYTAIKYEYEAVLSNISTFTSTSGTEMIISPKDVYYITSTLAYLCQVEAMNNVKRSNNANDQNIMDLVASWKLNNFKDFSGKTADQNRDETMKAAISKLDTLFTEDNWDLPANFANTMVEVLYHAAKVLKDKSSTPAFNILKERTHTKMGEFVLNAGEGFDFDYEGGWTYSDAEDNSINQYLVSSIINNFNLN